MASVEYPDADPNGLAEMLGGLIQGNLERHPERASLLKPAVIGAWWPTVAADGWLTIAAWVR